VAGMQEEEDKDQDWKGYGQDLRNIAAKKRAGKPLVYSYN